MYLAKLLLRFQYQIERRLRRAPKPCKACLRKYAREPYFAGLGSEPEAHVLRQGVRRADHRGRCIVQASNRRRILGEGVAGEWLHQEHGAIILQRLAGVAGSPDRITHVMQTIEEADQIKVPLGVLLRRGRGEGDATIDASVGGALARNLHRGLVEVNTNEPR